MPASMRQNPIMTMMRRTRKCRCLMSKWCCLSMLFWTLDSRPSDVRRRGERPMLESITAELTIPIVGCLMVASSKDAPARRMRVKKRR